MTYRQKDDYNRFLFPEEYEKVYKQLRINPRHTYTCLFNTGARINEIRNVTWGDINFESRWILLRITKTKARKGERRGKPRHIPISSQFCRYLSKKKRGKGLNDLIGIMSTSAFNRALKSACKEVGVRSAEDFSAHNLRKTFETYLFALDVPMMKVLTHLAHDARTASQNYVNPDIFSMEQKWRMRQLIGDLYG